MYYIKSFFKQIRKRWTSRVVEGAVSSSDITLNVFKICEQDFKTLIVTLYFAVLDQHILFVMQAFFCEP